jgi:hypothetical protein
MAGIGSRLGARPVIVDNECFENEMAGIGSREGAAPIIRSNKSYKNRMAGIGSRLAARPVIVDNHSRDNQMAGIGVRGSKTTAVIIGNRCIQNRLVAVGLPDGATAFIHGNELLRKEGGAPPLVAVKGGSTAVVSHNSIAGGGVAGVLIQGHVQVIGNRFLGKGPGQGSAVWIWKESNAIVSNNRVKGYRNAVNASGSWVTAISNVTSEFSGPSIIVRKPSGPAHVYGNTAVSDQPKNTAVVVDSLPNRAGNAVSNVLTTPAEFDTNDVVSPPVWPLLSTKQVSGDSFHGLANTGTKAELQDGDWKLVATYGKTTTYELFNTENDPQLKTNLAKRLDQITFRLRGLLEQKDEVEFQAKMKGNR